MVQPTTDDPTLEIIFNLKRKVAEPEDDSDSDASSIGQAPTNRGKKLKRNARYVHRGRLAGEYGLMLDGAIVEYGGRLRTVIDHNPKRRRKNTQDEDDDEEEEEDDEEREPYDDDTWPYSQVSLKELLIPLSHPSELVTHPALCRTFKSNKIRVLAEQALESIRTEHAHMTKLSKLLSILLGDENIFAEPEEPPLPMPAMEDSDSDKDVDIMDLDEPAAKEPEIPNGETNGHATDNGVDVNGVQTNGTTEPHNPDDPTPSEETAQLPSQAMETDDQQDSSNRPASSSTLLEPPPINGTAPASATLSPSRSPTPQAATRPTTRLQTAATIRPRTSATEFTWPSSLVQSTPATSAADLGLTPAEASEVRRMVQAALERSQEFLRCLEKVRSALVRADRQRKMVWLWCKDSAKLVAEQEREENP